jgi:hypothetical protein
MTPSEIARGLSKLLEQNKSQLANCERMLELLKPEWDLFEARTGHNIYVARDYADHFSAARKHREQIALLEAAVRAIIEQESRDE